MSVFNNSNNSFMNTSLSNINEAGTLKIQAIASSSSSSVHSVNTIGPVSGNITLPLTLLSDVYQPGGAPPNNSIPVWSSALGKWVLGTIIIDGVELQGDGAGNDLGLLNLVDVNVNTPDTSYALLYNPSTLQWTGAYLNVNGQDFTSGGTFGTSSLGLDQLADVNINVNQNGHMLQYDSTSSKYITVPSSTVNAFLGWDSSGYALGKDFGTFIATNYMGSQKGCLLIGQSDGVVQAVYPGSVLSGATPVWDSSGSGSGVTWTLGNPLAINASLVLYYNSPGTQKTYTAATISSIQPLGPIIFSSGDITDDNLGSTTIKYNNIGFKFTSLGIGTGWEINTTISISTGSPVGIRGSLVWVENLGTASQLIYTQTQVTLNVPNTNIILPVSMPTWLQYSSSDSYTYDLCWIPDNVADFSTGFSVWSYSLTVKLS